MQRIHLFLASSLVEFAHERKELGDFIRVLNDRYIERGLYFALTLCEDMSKALVQGRKQEEYNEKIRGAQYFYLLFGQEIGVYTLEEFDVALASFRASGAPCIEVFYHLPARGEAPAQSALDFMRRLDREIGHYFARYSHLDTVKLEMLMELARAPALHSTVTFKDGQAVLDNVPVLSLQNVPLYSQNPAVRRLAAERDRLLAEYDQLTARCRQEPDNTQLLQQRRQVNGQCLELEKQLHQAEADMCELFCTLQEKRSQPGISLWEKEALQRLEEGDYEGAKAILRDNTLEDVLRAGRQMADLGKEQIRQYISAKRTLIRTLRATGLDQDSVREIKNTYKKLTKIAQDYYIGPGLFFERILFECEIFVRHISLPSIVSAFATLMFMLPVAYIASQNHLEVGQELLWFGLLVAVESFYFACAYKSVSVENRFFNKGDSRSNQDIVWLSDISLVNISIIGGSFLLPFILFHVFPMTISLKTSIVLSLELGFFGGGIFFFLIFFLNRNINQKICHAEQSGWRLLKRNRFYGAEEKFQETIQLCKKYAHLAPCRFGRCLANSHNNLGVLYVAEGKQSEAEKHFSNAIKICEQLTIKKSAPHGLGLICVYNNLGALYAEQRQYQSAEKWLRKAFESCSTAIGSPGVSCESESLIKSNLQKIFSLKSKNLFSFHGLKEDYYYFCIVGNRMLPYFKG